MRILGTLAVATLVLLGGCRSPGPEAADHGPPVEVPAGWAEVTDERFEPPVRYVARGEGDEFVVVKVYDEPDAAEGDAIHSAVELADAAKIFCRRHDRTTVSDGPLLDCPDHTRRPWMRKLYVVIERDDASALVVVQTYEASYPEAVAVVTPIVESFSWEAASR